MYAITGTYVHTYVSIMINFSYIASSESDYKLDTNTIKTLDEYNRVIRNEYIVSSTNLVPEYYQKHKQSVPNPCE